MKDTDGARRTPLTIIGSIGFPSRCLPFCRKKIAQHAALLFLSKRQKAPTEHPERSAQRQCGLSLIVIAAAILLIHVWLQFLHSQTWRKLRYRRLYLHTDGSALGSVHTVMGTCVPLFRSRSGGTELLIRLQTETRRRETELTDYNGFRSFLSGFRRHARHFDRKRRGKWTLHAASFSIKTTELPNGWSER